MDAQRLQCPPRGVDGVYCRGIEIRELRGTVDERGAYLFVF